MANLKEIRTKIASVKNTQKITSAMEMVAASRMRKTQERMARGRPYSDHIRSVIGHVANASPERFAERPLNQLKPILTIKHVAVDKVSR